MRSFLTLLVAAVGIYALLALVLYLFQNRMVFLANMPERALAATPADAGWTYEDVFITTGDGLRLHAWFVAAEQSTATLLFFHGNAGNISHRLDSIAIMRELGLDILIIDYRGYGLSEGKPSERGTYLDARAAWDYLVDVRKVPPARIVVFGRSLGGAVAAHLASQTRPAAVILESCFSSALDMARRLYPFMPARLITRLKYPVKDYVQRMNSPLLVVHSRSDEIIPFSMGQAIFDAAPEPRQFLEIRGDHNSGFLLSSEIYLAGLKEFFEAHVSSVDEPFANGGAR